MQAGSPRFEAYSRTLRRVMWADFIEAPVRLAREQQYRASLVQVPYVERKPLAVSTPKPRQER